ncbi:hypothetical protein DL93DRAFT_2084552 [Clavulina sp. PMI_390]|nr:hypothetical protein DL93DRAFT_2084552 [Clavulina sp. PMI_390]
MVVLAASIVTKSGRPLLSRQFREMPRSRIEGLLASFPKLIPANSQHTSVETDDVRYVYQPLEELYILLITNKASNILLDIDTLHLASRVVSDLTHSPGEGEILKNSFEILGAFDEIISLGYREHVNLMQVRNVLEMESHEEKIQEIISRNKEAEAKEELKRRAKALELQRRDQARRQGGGGGPPGGFGTLGAGSSGYASIPRYDGPSSPRPSPSPTPSVPKGPAFKGSGMKLGGKKVQQSKLLDALGAEAEEEAPLMEAPAAVAPQIAQVELPAVAKETVHIAIQEQLSLTLLQAGGLKELDVKGTFNLLISSADANKAQVTIAQDPTFVDAIDAKSLQYKYHPNLARTDGGPALEEVIRMKDAARSWPVGTALGVLRWRAKSKDESLVPLSINAWPSPTGDGTADVNIEYELEHESLEIYNLAISIPLPEGGYPTVASHTGEWVVDPTTHSLLWTAPRVSPHDDTKTGTLEFSVGGDDAATFFPIKVDFTAIGSLIGITVEGVTTSADSSEQLPFSQENTITAEDYVVV